MDQRDEDREMACQRLDHFSSVLLALLYLLGRGGVDSQGLTASHKGTGLIHTHLTGPRYTTHPLDDLPRGLTLAHWR